MTNRANQWIKKAFQKLREFFGGKCQECGRTDRLEFAHIGETPLSRKGRGRGRKERYYDILRHPLCYKLLCHDCHRRLDIQLKSGSGLDG